VKNKESFLLRSCVDLALSSAVLLYFVRKVTKVSFFAVISTEFTLDYITVILSVTLHQACFKKSQKGLPDEMEKFIS
jgi:hypothetical protein